MDWRCSWHWRSLWRLATGNVLESPGVLIWITDTTPTSSTHSLGLGKNTSASLNAFRKRSDEAKRALTALQSQKTDVDLDHYRSVLKNQDVVKQAEKIISEFKPVSYDVSAQLKAIDAFESKATEQAKATESKIASELKDLKATLSNIEGARPFDQLTTDDLIAARPEIKKTVEEMVSSRKGRQEIGVYTGFSDLTLLHPLFSPLLTGQEGQVDYTRLPREVRRPVSPLVSWLKGQSVRNGNDKVMKARAERLCRASSVRRRQTIHTDSPAHVV